MTGRHSIALLDGGMGQELLRRHSGDPTPLWSARVMMDAPELVEAVHLDYIRSGARVITVNAYSATRCRLETHGVEDRFETLQRTACELACRARDKSGEEVAVAGCLSPLDWSYRPELARPLDEMVERYAEAARLQAPLVDVMLCETMSSAVEGKGAAAGAADAGKPVWLSWSVADDGSGRLRSGETLDEAAAAIDGLDLAARLLNCSMPESIDAGFDDLLAMGGPVGAYANGFSGIDPAFGPGSTVKVLEGRSDLGPEAYADFAMGWVERGARIVGGCCEVGPDHIAALVARLTRAGHEITGGVDALA